jgi:hypothetical protein
VRADGEECCGLAGIPSERKGAGVARKRPTASDVVPPIHIAPEDAKPDAWAALTRAEAHALRRSTPLTPAQFKAQRRLAEQGISPLRHV